MWVWPEPLPDETLYSLLARTSRLNGMPTGLVLCDQLTGGKSISILQASFRLPELCELAGGCLGSPEQVLRQMTAFHVATTLGDISVQQLTNLESGAEAFNLSAGESGGFGQWRFCPECVAAEINDVGIAWWHRPHQLPTTLVCPSHGIPLHRCDVKRRQMHEQFFLPTDMIDAMAEVEEVPAIDGFADGDRLAQIGADALRDAHSIHSQEIIRRSFIAGLAQQGFVTRGGNLRREEFVSSFGTLIGSQSFSGRAGQQGAIGDPMVLLNGLWRHKQCTPPLIKLLLVHRLFGSWKLFRERCEWEAAFQPEIREPIAVTASEVDVRFVESLHAHRKICEVFLASERVQSRSDFWRASPKSLRWLKRHDAAWLNERLPLKPLGKRQRGLF